MLGSGQYSAAFIRSSWNKQLALRLGGVEIPSVIYNEIHGFLDFVTAFSVGLLTHVYFTYSY